MDDKEALATLDEIREAIDQADSSILKIIAMRFKAVRSAHRLKTMFKKPILDKKREEELKQRWKALAKELKIREEFALLILDLLLHESKHIQQSES